jgi:hypothetical protein
MHTWVPSFWSQGILRISVWGPSGALVKRQGSHKMLSGHKGPVHLRPRCIEAVGSRPVYIIYLIYLTSVSTHNTCFNLCTLHPVTICIMKSTCRAVIATSSVHRLYIRPPEKNSLELLRQYNLFIITKTVLMF